MIEPDEGNRAACDKIDERAILRNFRRNPSLNPEAQPVEAPGRGPSQQWAKDARIDHLPKHAKASFVVVPRKEANRGFCGHVLPIARAHLDQRLWIRGPEFQTRRTRSAVAVSVSGALSISIDSEAEADSSAVQEFLGFVSFLGKILDLIKTKVPSLVKLRILGLLPKLVHAGANRNFDVDAHGG